MADSKQTVVAFLTSFLDSSVIDFVNGISEEMPELICKHVQLSNDVSEEFDAVVLLHSVREGRLSLTDVPDAKHNDLLPQLKKKYGAGRVAVVVYSIMMPSLQQSYNKDVMMMVFKRSQPTTFKCSKCVIQCNNLHEMDSDYRRKLISFLHEVRNSPRPDPLVEGPFEATENHEEGICRWLRQLLRYVEVRKNYGKERNEKTMATTESGITEASLGNTKSTSPRSSTSTSVDTSQGAAAAAGDVSNSTARRVSDEMLIKLAKEIPSDAYNMFSVKLGIGLNQASNILKEMGNNYEKATMDCMRKWRNKSTRSMADLHEVLKASDIGGLID